MADIQQLSYPYFTDNSTALNAINLNPIIAKINELVVKVNGSSSEGGSTGSGGTGSGGQQTPTDANLFVLLDSTFGLSIRSSDGLIVANPPMCLSDYISVKASTKYTFKARYVVAWYDSSKTFISASPSNDSKLTLTSPSNAAYCRFCFDYETNNALEMVMNEGDNLAQGTQNQSLPNYPELVNANTITDGVYIKTADGMTANAGGFKTTDYISVNASTEYTFRSRFVVAWYDSGKNFISASPSSEGTNMTLTSPSNAAYCRFCVASGTDVKYISMNEGSIACNIY